MNNKGSKSKKAAMKVASPKMGQNTPSFEENRMLAMLSGQNQFIKAEALAWSLTSRFPLYGYGWKVLGVALHQLGRIEEALAAMQKAAELLVDDAEAHYNLAFNLHQQNRLIEAESSLRRALELNADYAEAHSDLGIILKKQGKLAEAEASYRRVLDIYPNLAEAHSNLGNVLFSQGRPAEAEAGFRRALELNPGLAEAHGNLGNVLVNQGRLHEAEICFRSALAIKPDFADAHNNLGNICWGQGRLAEAEASLLRALQINPDHADALNNLGNVFWEQGRLTETEACFRRALEINPDLAEVHSNLGNIFLGQGKLPEAEAGFRKALVIKPGLAEAYSNLLFCLMHDEHLTPETCLAEHIAFAERFEDPLRAGWQPHFNERNPNRRLKVGFVSGDLYNHAVANFIEPVWAALAPEAIDLWVYSNHLMEDAVTLRLRQLAPHWRTVLGLSDTALAEIIRADGIDILIDLSGHTGGNRLLSFARKPAPVQASWIGYPGTTGLAAIDYLICDRFNAPHGLYECYYSEQFARLPSTGAFEPVKDAPTVNELPAFTNGYITFASFNCSSKLGEPVIAAWSRVLRALPGARLLLCPVSDEVLVERLTARFGFYGIEAGRLRFRPKLPMDEYLALHQEADIMLDTWPYTGGTTTNHALWMGVPAVTLRGPSRAHCQSAAALCRIGLEDWVADDVEGFVSTAIAKAQDIGALAALRNGMRERWLNSPWRQSSTVARGLEAALRMMWQRWCAGLPAAHFEVPVAERHFSEAPVSVAHGNGYSTGIAGHD